MDIRETTFLAGLVTRRSLPPIHPPFPDGMPARKRLMLPQGELAELHDGLDAIRYIAFLEMRPGTIRGNHFHHVKAEYFYLTAGEVSLVVENPHTKLRESVPLHPGDLAFVPAGVAHALLCLQPGTAVEFSPAAFDRTDVCKYPLL